MKEDSEDVELGGMYVAACDVIEAIQHGVLYFSESVALGPREGELPKELRSFEEWAKLAPQRGILHTEPWSKLWQPEWRRKASSVLRRAANYLCELDDRRNFQNVHLYAALVGPGWQRVLQEACRDKDGRSVPVDGSGPRKKVELQGYDFWIIRNVNEWTDPLPDLDAKFRKIVQEGLDREGGRRFGLIVPSGRHDELLMELFTTVWLGLYFLGEQYDVLWSIVERIANSSAGGLSSGCVLYKAYGDVYRDAGQYAEEVWAKYGIAQVLHSNLRVRSNPKRPAFFGEPDFYAAKSFEEDAVYPFDLTHSSFRSLGALYLYWQVAKYIRMELLLTVIVEETDFNHIWLDGVVPSNNAVAPGNRELPPEYRISKGITREDAAKWARFTFGMARADDEPSAALYDYRTFLRHEGVRAGEHFEHEGAAVVPKTTGGLRRLQIRGLPDENALANDYVATHTALYVSKSDVSKGDVSKRESLGSWGLANATVGPRIGASSMGRSPLSGNDLPFSGRRLHGDMLGSYSYAYRYLARELGNEIREKEKRRREEAARTSSAVSPTSPGEAAASGIGESITKDSGGGEGESAPRSFLSYVGFPETI